MIIDVCSISKRETGVRETSPGLRAFPTRAVVLPAIRAVTARKNIGGLAMCFRVRGQRLEGRWKTALATMRRTATHNPPPPPPYAHRFAGRLRNSPRLLPHLRASNERLFRDPSVKGRALRPGKEDILGYARGSTADQETSGQNDCLREAGAIGVFADVISGDRAERPGLAELIYHARPGERLCVTRLDRLGRSLEELLKTVEDLKKRGIHLVSLEERIDTTSAAGGGR